MRWHLALALAFFAGACATQPVGDLAALSAMNGYNSFEVVERAAPPQSLALSVVQDRQISGPACGAHVLASLINYWRGEEAADGRGLFLGTPPAHPSGYSMAELVAMAQQHGLRAAAVRLTDTDLIGELERGRPVIVPVRLPAIYLQRRTFPGSNLPLLGIPANALTHRVARLSEMTDAAMVDHYVLAAGYSERGFLLLEPILGLRTISRRKFQRYRAPFGNAALVFSG